MTEQTDSELAYSLIGALEPLGAQWAQLEDAVRGRPRCAHALLDEFGKQIVEIGKLVRLAAQRLEARGEISEAELKTTIRAVCGGRYARPRGCLYPECDCDLMPAIVRAALEASRKG